MKLYIRFLLLVCACLVVTDIKAQLIPVYSFSQSTGTYIPVTLGTVLASGSAIDDNTYSVTLPFSFTFDGTAYTQIYVSTNGFISFGSIDPMYYTHFPISSPDNGFKVAAAYGYDLNSLDGTTELSTYVTGSAPNRTYIVQWKNFSYSVSSGLIYNFQVRLNESTNTVEVVYGNMTTVLNTTTGEVGLRGSDNTTFNNRTSTTGWTSTAPGTSNTDRVTFSPSYMPSSGLTFKWTPPPPCTAPLTSPSGLSLFPGHFSVSGNFTGSSGVSGYLVVRTNGVPLDTYPANGTFYAAGSTLGNGTVVDTFSGTSFSAGGVVESTNYTFTIFPYNNSLCTGGPAYKTSAALTGNVTTLKPNAYTWIATSGTADWQVAANWLPARTAPIITDTLYFRNGGTPFVSNIPTQQVGVIRIANNTNTSFQSETADTLTMRGLLAVDAGSTLTIRNQPLTLAFAAITQPKNANISGTLAITGSGVYNAANATTTVNGTLSLKDTSNYMAADGTTIINGTFNVFDTSIYLCAGGSTTTNAASRLNIGGKGLFDLSSSTVVFNGTVNDSGAKASVKVVTAGPTSVQFAAGSVYNHMRNGGTIPAVSYDAGSTVNITGVTNSMPVIAAGQDFGSFNWNCASQAASLSLNSLIDSVKGTFTISNTNSYVLKTGAGSSQLQVNNFVQTGGTYQATTFFDNLVVYGNATLSTGTLDLQGGTPNLLTTTFNGNVTQLPGHTITKTGTGTPTLQFAGTSSQNITMNGSTAPVAVSYVLNNVAGANLTGTINIGSGGSNSINAGAWTGSGAFSYASTNTTLSYSSSLPLTPSNVDWPAVNGPANFNMTLSGLSPDNQLKLPGTRSIPGYFTNNAGVLVLNAYNFTCVYSTMTLYTSDGSTMIAADSTGYFKLALPAIAGDVTYYYPIGTLKGSPRYLPASLKINTGTTARNIGVRVKNIHHPADASITNYLRPYWSFTDDGGSAPYTYAAGFGFLNGDVVGSPDFTVNRWDGASWQQLSSILVPHYIETGSDQYMNMTDALTSSAHPLNNSDFAGRTSVHNIYNWTGAISTDYQVAGNWSPNRVNLSSADILRYGDGHTDTVKNIPSQTIGRMIVTNNTTIIMQSSVNGAAYNINTDWDTTTDEMHIDSASTVIVNGTLNSLRFAFTGSGSKATIAGRFELVNTAYDNSIDFNNCTGTVTSSGTLACGTTNSTDVILTDANLTINGTYEHKYTTVAGYFPSCNWGPHSTLLVKGYTTGTGSPGYIVQPAKFIYNCPAQTSLNNWYSLLPSATDSFIVISTGTGQWIWAALTFGSTAYTVNINNYYQSGGYVNLSNSFNSTAQLLNISGSFTQTGGTFLSSGTGTTSPLINFNGATTAQNVTFNNAAPSGPISYQVSNPYGINLIGTGTLTSVFNINSGASMRISSPVASPVNTTLSLQYAAANTTLIYDAAANFSADPIVYPATNGPANLTINMGTANSIIFPFSRTIPGTLKMVNGNINAGANSLTLGTSSSSPGTLAYSSGYLDFTTGSFIRWFGTTGLPTTPDINAGFYPLGHAVSNRSVYLYFNSGTALSAGGTIGVSHSNVAGLTTGLSVTDGSYTINKRTNSSWTFTTGNGITSTGTLGAEVTGGDLLTVSNISNLRLMKATSVVGAHAPGSGALPDVMAQRTGLTLADITSGPFYIGSDGANINTIYISVANGNWSNGSTWNVGTAPVAGSVVIIAPYTTVTDNVNAHIQNITVQPLGTLNISTNSLAVDSFINNNGTINITGSSLTLGPVGGGKNILTNAGSLSISSGSLYINGNLLNTSGSAFSQTGGNIYVDGNAAGVAANSAGGYIALVNFNSSNLHLDAGTFTIVDPSINSSEPTAIRFSSGGSVSANKNHTFVFGDGISTAPGVNGFNIDLGGSFGLGSVIVNGSPSGLARTVNLSGIGLSNIVGDLTINNTNGRFNVNSGHMAIGGNIYANAGAVFDAGGRIDFIKNDPAPGATRQTINGPGTFQNWNYFYIGNNVGGVVTNIGNFTIPYTLEFGSGNLFVGGGATLYASTNIINGGTGWVVGKLKRPVSGSSYGYTYPIGDTTRYTPLTITGNVATGGYIIVDNKPVDHPNIATSPINPAKSANRYFIIDTGGGLTFTGGTASVTAHWDASDVDPGANGDNFFTAVYRGGTWAVLDPNNNGYYGMVNPISIPGLAGSYIYGEAGVAPVITTQPVAQSVCNGADAVFHVAASPAKVYQWQLNTGPSWVNVTNSATYSGSQTNTLNVTAASLSMNGYHYRCKTYNSFDSTTSASVTLNVGLPLVPSITISTGVSDTLCAGILVTFTAAPVNGGTTPAYQWKKNGVPIGTNSSVYSSSALANGDVITCTMISGYGCAIPASVTSNAKTMTVKSVFLPTIYVASSASGLLCSGTSVSYSSTTNVTGGTYQWVVNSAAVAGATNAAYTYAPLNSDHISCIVHVPSNACSLFSAAGSNTVIMTVNNYLTPFITITGTNPVCESTSNTYTATGNISGATNLWFVNGILAGSGPDYTYTPVNHDLVSCVITVPATGCYTAVTDTSNIINMTVKLDTIPAVTISTASDTICDGSSASFASVANITGATRHWFVNSSPVTGTPATYTYAPASGDVVTCVITTPATGCYASTTDTSDGIVMTLNPVLTPTVSVTGPTSLCAGTAATYVAGTTISPAAFQWTLNGLVISGSTDTSYNYTPVDGDILSIKMTPASGCYAPSFATSATTITVIPNVVPGDAISASTNNICAGTHVTFTATSAVVGGVYNWQVNGITIGLTGTSFTYPPVNGDIIKNIVTAPPGTCYTENPDTSNAISMVVNPVIVPTISIAGPISEVAGNTVSLTATVTNAGSAYLITWMNHSVTFNTTTAPAVDYVKAAGTDIITAKVWSTVAGCYDTTVSGSITITEKVDTAAGIGSIREDRNIAAYPNPFSESVTLKGLKINDRVTLYDVTGKSIGDGQTIVTDEPEHTLTLTHLAPGTYILKVGNESRVIKSFTLQKR